MTTQKPVPGLPESLRQSFDNPIQLDRLAQDQAPTIELPASSGTPEQRSKIIRGMVVFAVFFCLVRSLPEYVLPISWAVDIWGFFGFFACATIVACLVGWPKTGSQWLIYIVALPFLFHATAYLRSMFFLLILACVFTAVVADRYAKQTLYLGTVTPFQRIRAKQIRKNWRARFTSLNTSRGLEFYVLSILGLLATPWIFVSLTPASPVGDFYSRFQALLATAGLVICMPVFIELLAAMFYARPPLGLRVAWRGFKRTFSEWACYNHNNVVAPGLLQSPVGASKTRRRMLVAVICLWATTINPIFSYRIGMEEALRESRLKASAEQKKKREEAAAVNEDLFLKRLRGEPLTKSWQTQEPVVVGKTPTLEPYQQRMLERMPAEQRSAYLQSLQSASTPKPVPVQKSSAEALASQALGTAVTIASDSEEVQELYGTQYNERVSFLFSFGLWLFIIRELMLIGFSFAFPIAFFYAASVRIAASLRQQLETHPDTILSFGNWEQLVADVSASEDLTEKQSLLLGVNATDNSPVMVPLKVFEEHAHILGDSGSGKTSMGIALILNQLIRQKDCSIVVIDLKGDDKALFAGTKQDAEACGKRFRWFTNELGKSTYGFNPLDQEYFSALSLYQKTDVMTAALGLQYGTDYGRGFYSDANADYLYRTLQAHPGIRTFQQLARILPTGYGVEHITHETRRDASHLTSIVQRLSATESLNVTQNPANPSKAADERIDFADVFRTPQVVYVHLPSSLGTTSSAEIARVALYSLIGSARCTPDKDRKQVFVFIDEFQRIIANNLELIMQTARSMKIGIILANQSMLDLKKPGVDLTPAVRTNTRYKQVFAASNIDELREMIDASGEALVYQRSYAGEAAGAAIGFLAGGVKLTQSEHTTPRMRVNDVLLATDAPDQSIVQIRRGAGYAQFGGMPFVMRSTFHISPEEYATRKAFPWPEDVEGTLVGKEVVQQSVLDEFPPVEPLAGTTRNAKPPIPKPAAMQGSASGATDPLDELAAAQRKRQENAAKKRKNSPDQEPPSSSP